MVSLPSENAPCNSQLNAGQLPVTLEPRKALYELGREGGRRDGAGTGRNWEEEEVRGKEKGKGRRK